MGRMSFRKGSTYSDSHSAHNADDDAEALTWDYEDETFAYRRPAGRPVAASTAASATGGTPGATKPAADARAQRVQRALNQALDEWWRRGVLPADDLLRDGLLVLEAGHDLDESQRTLLLRTALARRRGMVTALRYQTDPERTAVLIEESLFKSSQPLAASELARLQQSDDQSAAWTPALVELLHTAAAIDGAKRTQATAALAVLAAAPLPVTTRTKDAPPVASPWIEGEAASSYGRNWPRRLGSLVLLAVVIGVVGGAVVWWQRTQPATMIEVPPGAYRVTLEPAGVAQVVELPAFRIDRYEATVSDYRTCYERGACPWPATPASATRANYLLDPASARFPMINIDYDSADRFCRFMGKRLPTAAEWEVAAASAPATGRMYRFPWGDEFAVQRANSAQLGIGDTVQIGAFQPAGDSPLGASDMAGNVAEWTSSTVVQDAVTLYLVKGGAFGDEPDKLRTMALAPTPPRTAANWLGVRCTADVR